MHGTDHVGSADINTRKLFLTVFKDAQASTLYHGEYTLPEWRERILEADADAKAALFWLKGARFGDTKSKKQSYRTNLNVLSITAIVVEHDAGTVSFDEAVAILTKAGVRALVYTSPSHAADKQRWRVILPLSADMPKTKHDILAAMVNGLFGGALSPESFVLSQSYYFGSVVHNPEHRCEVIDGKFLDLHDRLYAGSIFSDGSRVGDSSPIQRLRDTHNEDGKRGAPNNFTRAGRGQPDDPAKVAFALNQISSDIPYRAKDGCIDWMTVGAAVASEVEHDKGFKIFDAWSKHSARYDATKIAERWDAFCDMSFIGIGTLYHFATEANPNWRNEWKAEAESSSQEQAGEPPQPDADWSGTEQFEGWLDKGVEALPNGISARCKIIVAHVGTIDNLNTDLKRAVGGKPHAILANLDEIVVALAVELLEFRPAMPVEKVAAALLCDLKCNAPITKLSSNSQKRNAADRAIFSARQKIAESKASSAKPDDRGIGDNGEVPLYQIVADAFFKNMRSAGHDLQIVIDKDKVSTFWFYNGDVWSMIPDVAEWLNPQLQTAIRGIKHKNDSSIKLIAEARFALTSEPALISETPVVFDDHGMVPIRDFLIDPLTGKLVPMLKSHYCTWHLGDIYDKDAECPHWLRMLDDSFADRSEIERAKVIALQQEFLGAALIDNKPKALRRAMVYEGPPDCGKTELIKTMSGMLTNSPISTPLGDLNAAHGLQEFARRVVWVLHEAFDQGVWHLSSRVKAILSGDPQSINPKNHKAFTMAMRVVAMWATNSPPKFKESTDAILIRLIIIRMKIKFIPGQLIGTALVAKENGFAEPHEFVLARERSGMLNWALAGLQRVVPVGRFSDTEDSKAAADELRLDSNYMAGFIADCVTFSDAKMLSVPDLHLTLGSWWKENRGDEKIPPGADAIGRQLGALHDQRIGQDNKKFRNREGIRFHPGLTLNTAGIDHFSSEHLRLSTLNVLPRGVSSPVGEAHLTLKAIPRAWDDHPQIQAIRKLAKAAEAEAKIKPETDPDVIKEAELAARRATRWTTHFP